jgi:hypothetical protein
MTRNGVRAERNRPPTWTDLAGADDEARMRFEPVNRRPRAPRLAAPLATFSIAVSLGGCGSASQADLSEEGPSHQAEEVGTAAQGITHAGGGDAYATAECIAYDQATIILQ